MKVSVLLALFWGIPLAHPLSSLLSEYTVVKSKPVMQFVIQIPGARSEIKKEINFSLIYIDIVKWWLLSGKCCQQNVKLWRMVFCWKQSVATKLFQNRFDKITVDYLAFYLKTDSVDFLLTRCQQYPFGNSPHGSQSWKTCPILFLNYFITLINITN